MEQINNIYEFNKDDAYSAAIKLGIETKQKGNELIFRTCPYCRGGKHRDKDTFSISLMSGQYQCKRASCDIKGNMITLARDHGIELSDIVNRYYNINNYNSKFRTFRAKHIEVKDAAIQYLESRGISEKVAREYELTTKEDDSNILVFPFKNEQGEIKFIKYRNMTFKKGESFGSKEWTEKNCMPILFGMNKCNTENDTLIITEGQMDSLSVTEAGYENAVSVPIGCNGFTWVPHCWDWVHQFKRIIVFGDYENGKISLLDEIQKRFRNLEIYHVSPEDYLDCKDANDILRKYGKEQIAKCIDQAVMVPINHIVRLADVKSIDIFAMEKLKTNLPELDKMLFGGLPFGGVTLISGKPGEGKSTLASQILLQAMIQGYKCFAYSGELPNYVFKEWIDFQNAGPYVQTYTNKNGDEYYVIPEEIKDKMNEWYGDRCILFDNDVTTEIGEYISIASMVEQAILRYGAKVILIDNLMTALDYDDSDGDKYEKQSRFMKKLVKIALTYNVIILLVAHKRKNAQTENENDEISGSGDIANLAMVTLSYQKDKQLENNQRLLKVSKNRLFGTVNAQGWTTSYDKTDRRISTAKTDNNWISWNDNNGFYEVPENEDLPF